MVQYVVCRGLIAGCRRAPCAGNKGGVQQACDAVNQVVAVRNCLADGKRDEMTGVTRGCGCQAARLVQVQILCRTDDLGPRLRIQNLPEAWKFIYEVRHPSLTPCKATDSWSHIAPW